MSRKIINFLIIALAMGREIILEATNNPISSDIIIEILSKIDAENKDNPTKIEDSQLRDTFKKIIEQCKQNDIRVKVYKAAGLFGGKSYAVVNYSSNNNYFDNLDKNLKNKNILFDSLNPDYSFKNSEEKFALTLREVFLRVQMFAAPKMKQKGPIAGQTTAYFYDETDSSQQFRTWPKVEMPGGFFVNSKYEFRRRGDEDNQEKAIWVHFEKFGDVNTTYGNILKLAKMIPNSIDTQQIKIADFQKIKQKPILIQLKVDNAEYLIILHGDANYEIRVYNEETYDYQIYNDQ